LSDQNALQVKYIIMFIYLKVLITFCPTRFKKKIYQKISIFPIDVRRLAIYFYSAPRLKIGAPNSDVRAFNFRESFRNTVSIFSM